MSRIPVYKQLPDGFDPKDPALKVQFNPKADDLNFISTSRKLPYLACGATKKGKLCKNPAGAGTDHVGYGRCKYHGGASTGPRTPEGKATVARNGIIHGLYSKALLPHERELFNQFAGQEVGLEYEIALMKAKIVSYLKKNSAKWEKAYNDRLAQVQDEGRAAEYADRETRVWYTSVYESEEDGSIKTRGTSFYHAGTIEDKPLIRALETLGRLVDKHAKLKGLDKTDAEDIIEGINKELRAASYGQVSISWGGPAQQRRDKTEE